MNLRNILTSIALLYTTSVCADMPRDYYPDNIFFF